MAKTTDRIRVALGDMLAPVGEIVFEQDGGRQSSMFRYAPQWLEAPSRFAIAPTMPLSAVPFFASAKHGDERAALPGAVRDGMPDSWGRGLLRRDVGHALSEFDHLIGVSDLTRQGALRYLDEDGRPLAPTCLPMPRVGDLEALRNLATTPMEDMDAAARTRLVACAASLGGARPKANVVDSDGSLAVAKFTTDEDTLPIERVEVATLRLAHDAGIAAAGARLELGNTKRPVAVLRRFDRRSGHRIPYLSAQSFIGADAASGGFYTDIADALRVHGADPTKQLAELFRRILFTILVSNNDDHLKNHGLLHVGGGLWALSPAFDINPQPQRVRHLETGISELSGSAASIDAAMEAAPFFDIERDDAAAMLGRMVAVIDVRWRVRCREAGLDARALRAYAPAFDHPETQVARRLGTRLVFLRGAELDR